MCPMSREMISRLHMPSLVWTLALVSGCEVERMRRKARERRVNDGGRIADGIRVCCFYRKG